MENTRRDSTTTHEETSGIDPKTFPKEIGEKSRLVGTKLSSKLCTDLLTHLRKVGNVKASKREVRGSFAVKSKSHFSLLKPKPEKGRKLPQNTLFLLPGDNSICTKNSLPGGRLICTKSTYIYVLFSRRQFGSGTSTRRRSPPSAPLTTGFTGRGSDNL